MCNNYLFEVLKISLFDNNYIVFIKVLKCFPASINFDGLLNVLPDSYCFQCWMPTPR